MIICSNCKTEKIGVDEVDIVLMEYDDNHDDDIMCDNCGSSEFNVYDK